MTIGTFEKVAVVLLVLAQAAWPASSYGQNVHCTELLGDLHCDDGTRIRKSPLGGVDVDNQSLTKPYTPPPPPTVRYPTYGLDNFPSSPLPKKDAKVIIGILSATTLLLGLVTETTREESEFKCDKDYKNCRTETRTVHDSGAQTFRDFAIGVGTVGLIFSVAW